MSPPRKPSSPGIRSRSHRRPKKASRGAPPPALPPGLPGEAELTIDGLGQHGDGVGRFADRPVFVPGTAPGDRVRIAFMEPRGDGLAARALELLEPGGGRAEPPCPHFPACGGCRMQHLGPDVLAGWQRERVATAMARRGLGTVAVGEVVSVPRNSRRRATFAARRGRGSLFLGFNEEGTHRIVDMTVCHVLRPAIVALLPALRGALFDLLEEGAPADVHVAELDDGLDVLVIAEREPDLAVLDRLAALAADADLARIGWRRARGGRPVGPVEPVANRRPGILRLGGVPVVIPPGGFLQATAEGEAMLRTAVSEATAAATARGGRIADLFSGTGAFALPLATAGAVVTAVDGDAASIGALSAAANGHGLAPRLVATVRDLDSDPLTPEELAPFEAVVFDPPRAGARSQAAALAESAVPVVVAVSCNPASFARDARSLIDGGYACTGVTPVDQFLWSGHLELVAVFRRHR